MLIKKQNRILFFVFGFLILALSLLLSKQGHLNSDAMKNGLEMKEGLEENLPEPEQETMGEAIKEGTLDLAKLDELKMFQLILGDLVACFALKASSAGEPPPVTVEVLISQLQADFGPSTKQVDHWMNWHFKNREGLEKRIHLELNEDDEGKVIRSLKYFAVDKEGLPIPIELAPEKSMNPTDEMVSAMLKEGDVFYKEKSGVVIFAGGEHLEYIEKNGVLAEVELQKADRYFRCQNLKTRESCQCIR